MSPFERHGIKHLSPSSLNLFQANPALWCGRYLFKWADDAGPAAKRGTAVEAGLDVFLYERNQEKARAAALDNFALNTHGVADADYEKERNVIVPMLDNAMHALQNMGIPVARQVKIEHWLDNISVPIIGYIDYLWEAELIDLKSTLRIPSELKGDHARQVSLYWKARERKTSIVYVSDKKWSQLELSPDDAQRHLYDMRRAAETLQYVLGRADDAKGVARYYCPDFENFRWSDQTRKLARDMYAPL